MVKLLIATRNRHKVSEIQTMLGGSFDCLSLREFPDAPEVVEDADTFEGNAMKKAKTLADWLLQMRNAKCGMRNAECGMGNDVDLVLADDSGLEVDALDGAPGVYSARFAALDTGKPGNSTDADNNEKLIRLLKDVPDEKRTARFRCVLTLVPVHPRSSIRHPQSFGGACEGRIGFKPEGDHGFGYDPLFLPDGFQETFAQLGDQTKNRISHRSRALAAMQHWLGRPAG